MAPPKDPTEPLRLAAGKFAGVDQGTACTQAAFKIGNKSFLFVGPQGGRFKAMFKLDASMSEAQQLSKKHPDRFEAGSTGWVTARFTAEEPLPKSVWQRWLKESYDLTSGSAPKKKSAQKKATKKGTKRGKKSSTSSSRRVATDGNKKVVKKSSRKKTTKKKSTKASPATGSTQSKRARKSASKSGKKTTSRTKK